jgi:uncharacterized integral membrane protein (TIGR00697 family)
MNEWILLLQSPILMVIGFFLTYHQRHYGMIFVCLMIILANLFIIKQVDLFGLHVTASDAYFIAAACTLNVIQEMHGKKQAMEAMAMSFFGLILFSILTQIQFFYEPNDFDSTAGAFKTIFHLSLKISLVSLLCYWVSQRMDLFLYRLSRRMTYSQAVACFFAVAISQLLDTVMFSTLALSSVVGNLWHVIFFSYGLKLLILSISVGIMSGLYALLDIVNLYYESKI